MHEETIEMAAVSSVDQYPGGGGGGGGDSVRSIRPYY